MFVDVSSLDRAAVYRLMIGAIVPRPIAWVGSARADGTDNLAPFSYFMGVQSEPPLLAISVAKGRGGALKHTARNVLETREFTVSVVEERHLEAMHVSGGSWAESEFDVTGLARAPGERVAAPWVRDARVALECRLAHALDLGQAHLIVGEVVGVHVDETLVVDGTPVLAGLRPVARLGGDDYATLGRVVSRPRVRVDPAKSS